MTVDALKLPRRESRAARREAPRLGLARPLPYLLGALLLLAAGFTAVQLVRQDRARRQAEIATAAAGVSSDLADEVARRVVVFRRLAAHWPLDGPAGLDLAFEDVPALSALAWLGPGGASWQSSDGVPGAPDVLATLPGDGLDEILARVRSSGEPRFGPPVGPPGVQRILPLYVPLGSAAGGGVLVALLDSAELLRPILAEPLAFGYGVDVALFGVPVYRGGAEGGSGARAAGGLGTQSLSLFGAPWVLRIWPGAGRASTTGSWLPAAVLGAGLLLAAASSVGTRLVRYARRQAVAAERARRQLERVDREREQLAYVASHDLQEPLRQVVSFLSLLESRHREHLDADARECVGFALTAAGRMQRLVDDLRTYSHVGTRPVQPEPGAPADALASATAELHQAIADSGARIAQDDSLPRVTADPYLLTVVFRHLLSNAIHYAGDAAPSIRVSGRSRGAWVELTVADRGIGIDPRFFDRIFVVFQRLHPREEHLGAGLGLAIVRRAVERHGGRVWAESSAGEGSTFHFTLPAELPS